MCPRLRDSQGVGQTDAGTNIRGTAIQSSSRVGDTGKKGRGRLHLSSHRARGRLTLRSRGGKATRPPRGCPERPPSTVPFPQALTCMFRSSWKISMVRYTMSCTVSCPMRHSVAVLTSRAACCACGPPKGPGAMPAGASGGVDMALGRSVRLEPTLRISNRRRHFRPAATQASSRKTWEPVATQNRSRLGYAPETDGKLTNQ